jgi:hypothetical protein
MEFPMTSIDKLACLLALCFIADKACGHGTSLDISVEADRLIVSHPLDQTFAPPIFGQPDEYDDFADVDSFPGIGNVILWDIPGLEIHGMNGSASLSIEVLARPVIGSNPAERRLLWYWDPLSETVDQSPAEFHLFGTGGRVLSLHPEEQQSPPPFLLAAVVEGQTGFHNHSLMFYGLNDDETAPAGVYGFYARFTSNQYASSDPFLVIFNYFSDNELLPSASLAIHATATLPGDFDLDDDVDGRDFLIWQRLFGSTTRTVADASLNGIVDATDLGIWQQNYGTLFGSIAVLSVVTIPEPTTLAFILAVGLIAGHSRL